MRDDHSEQPEPAAASADESEAASGSAPADWVGAAGVSGEHLLIGERAPRLHWALMILGPIGLAVAIMLSLWSSSRQVERSVNVQVETTWAKGERLAARALLLGGDLEPVEAETQVSLAVEYPDGARSSFEPLTSVGPGLAQGGFEVGDLRAGEAELVLGFEPGEGSTIQPFNERIPITIVDERERESGRQVVAQHMLQWADDTDEQPAEVRIDVRPAGRLLAGFDNEVFVRVTDPAGEPWAPKPEGTPALIQVLLVSGEFAGEVATLDHQPILYEGPVDALGLASVRGRLTSDVVRFEVRLPGEADIAALTPKPAPAQPDGAPAPEQPEPPATSRPREPKLFVGPKRRLRFVSHAGTVRIEASTDFAHVDDVVTVTVDAISSRRPVFVDVHGPTGAWLDSYTLRVPQEQEWRVRDHLGVSDDGLSIMQFEAYQSTLRPEVSSSLARVQIAPRGMDRAAAIAGLITRQREQLALPRVDKQFEIERERAYLKQVEAKIASLDEAGVARARGFLLGSLEAVVHGPPQALNTRAREDQSVAEFKRAWTLRIRWFLLGGGGLFIAVMAGMVWRNQRKLEVQTSSALGLVEGSPTDAEAAADQSLSITRSRREVLVRGVFTIALMAAALLLTVAMLEALVWEY